MIPMGVVFVVLALLGAVITDVFNSLAKAFLFPSVWLPALFLGGIVLIAAGIVRNGIVQAIRSRALYEDEVPRRSVERPTAAAERCRVHTEQCAARAGHRRGVAQLMR